MTFSELEQLTFGHFPDRYWRRLLRGLFAAYDTTYRHCHGEYASTEAKNLWPYERRAKFEGHMRDAADLEGGRLSSRVAKASSGGWFHTEVIGGPIVLTAHSVQTPGAMAKRSAFGLDLATHNDLRLFEEQDEDGPDTVYAQLIHSHGHRHGGNDPVPPGLPGSAYVAFPAPGLESYFHQVNLFDRYQGTIKGLVPPEWDDVLFLRYLGRARRVA